MADLPDKHDGNEPLALLLLKPAPGALSAEE